MKVRTKFEVRSFTRSWDRPNSGYFKTLDSPWIRRSRSSKVVDFGTNRKRICDFLLVRHINKLVLSCTVSEILQVLCAPEWPHPYSTLILGSVSVCQMAHVGVSPSRGFKLFGREIIFEVFQPTWPRYLNVTDGQTTYCGITASRGKNCSVSGKSLQYSRYNFKAI